MDTVMNSLQNRLLVCASTLVALTILSIPASASLITYTQAMSGFSYNSDTVSSGFNSALGSPYTHISFSGASNTDGTSYSPNVTFSTTASGFGGLNTSLVNANSEIGPSNAWYGQFNIDFNGSFVSSVGFGLVDPVSTIKVFDTTNNLLGTFNDNLNTTFSLWGVQATAGEQIGRVELDGNFYAIQDIEFGTMGTSAVPDSASTLTLLGCAMVALVGIRRRYQSA